MKISVVLPSYQEGENLERIIPRIHQALREIEHEILVIDTMEPMDNTREICEKNEAQYALRQNGNSYGDAIRTGFMMAKGTYTVVMDADGSHSPEDIARFYREMKSGEYDLIIGSRYCKGGYTDNPLILRFMSWALNVTYRVLFGLKVKDVSDSYRMYLTRQIQSLSFECENFDIVEEILIKLRLNYPGLRILEMPISFNKRVAGESKRDLLKFIFSYLETMKRLMRIKHEIKSRKVNNE